QAEHDHPLRILEREDEAALGEVAGLLELVRLHGLGPHASTLLDDRLHGVVDPVDVDAALREERPRVRVALLVAVDVVGKAASLAYLGEEARRHPAAENRGE